MASPKEAHGRNIILDLIYKVFLVSKPVFQSRIEKKFCSQNSQAGANPAIEELVHQENRYGVWQKDTKAG